MTFPLSSSRAAHLEHPETTGSTNADLLARPDLRHGSVVATLRQTSGRGRLDRSWSAPDGETLAASVVLEPRGLDAAALGWLPLIAGVAMRASLSGLVAADAGGIGVKWPNDVQIDGLKVCGILAERRPDGAVVVGVGVNLTIPADRLPTPTSTSLALHGVDGPAADIADRVLAGFLDEVLSALDALSAAGGDAEAAGLRSRVSSECTTLGRDVRVELPDGSDLVGVATGLDPSGRLVVRSRSGHDVAVSSGDVTHLRYE